MNKNLIFTLHLAGLLFLSDAYAASCYDSYITSPSPFMGNNDEIFKLGDGSIWQVRYAYEYLYAYTPAVIICPGMNKLVINGKQIQVSLLSQGHAKRVRSDGRSTEQADQHGTKRAEKVVDDSSPSNDIEGDSASVIESQISGDFSGWEGETIFKLTNGQIWQQTTYAYMYHYAYSPKVLILKINGSYQMQVEGVNQRIGVARLK